MNDQNDFSKRLFIGGLDYDTTDVSLKKHFDQWGEVTSHHIVRFPDSGDSKGFGFVTFREAYMVDNCVDISHSIDGKKVDLRRVTGKESNTWKDRGNRYSKPNKSGQYTEARRLFIGGLDYETSDEKLKEYFEKFGEVTQHNVVRFESGDSRGFGFVTFKNELTVDECMKKIGPHQIDGKTVELKKVTSKEDIRDGGRRLDDEDKFDPESKQMRKLFVGGMGYDITEEHLESYFGKFGTLVETRVVKFPDSGKSRGFGFVMFEAAASVDECQKLRPHKLDDKSVETKRVTPKGDGIKGDAHITVKKIFIGGISDEIEDEHLEEYFGKFGKVEKVEQPRKPDSGRKRGFGFVEFEDSDTVDKIVLMPRFHQIGNRKLEVKKVLSKEQQEKAAAIENMPHMDGGIGYMDFGIPNIGSATENISGNMISGMRIIGGGMGGMGNLYGGMGNMGDGMIYENRHMRVDSGNMFCSMKNMRSGMGSNCSTMGGLMANEIGTPLGRNMGIKEASNTSSGEISNRLFIGGLSYETSDNVLRNYFQQFGKVTHHNIVRFSETGDSRGFGFVTFAHPMMVQLCLNSGPHRIQGNTVELRLVQDKDGKNKESGGNNKSLGGRSSLTGGIGNTRNVMSGMGRLANMTGGMSIARNEMGSGMSGRAHNTNREVGNIGGGGLGHLCSGGNWCGGGFGNICGHDNKLDQGMRVPMAGPGTNMAVAGGVIKQDRGVREGPYSRMGQPKWIQRN